EVEVSGHEGRDYVAGEDDLGAGQALGDLGGLGDRIDRFGDAAARQGNDPDQRGHGAEHGDGRHGCALDGSEAAHLPSRRVRRALGSAAAARWSRASCKEDLERAGCIRNASDSVTRKPRMMSPAGVHAATPWWLSGSPPASEKPISICPCPSDAASPVCPMTAIGWPADTRSPGRTSAWATWPQQLRCPPGVRLVAWMSGALGPKPAGRLGPWLAPPGVRACASAR